MHVYACTVAGDGVKYLLVTVCFMLQRLMSFNTSGCQDPSSKHVMMAVLFTPSQLTVAVVPTKAGLL